MAITHNSVYYNLHIYTLINQLKAIIYLLCLFYFFMSVNCNYKVIFILLYFLLNS